jgi:hypothetical protein
LACGIGFRENQLLKERRRIDFRSTEPASILPDFDEVRVSCPQGHLLCAQLVERGRVARLGPGETTNPGPTKEERGDKTA